MLCSRYQVLVLTNVCVGRHQVLVLTTACVGRHQVLLMTTACVGRHQVLVMATGCVGRHHGPGNGHWMCWPSPWSWVITTKLSHISVIKYLFMTNFLTVYYLLQFHRCMCCHLSQLHYIVVTATLHVLSQLHYMCYSYTTCVTVTLHVLSQLHYMCCHSYTTCVVTATLHVLSQHVSLPSRYMYVAGIYTTCIAV